MFIVFVCDVCIVCTIFIYGLYKIVFLFKWEIAANLLSLH